MLGTTRSHRPLRPEEGYLELLACILALLSWQVYAYWDAATSTWRTFRYCYKTKARVRKVIWLPWMSNQLQHADGCTLWDMRPISKPATNRTPSAHGFPRTPLGEGRSPSFLAWGGPLRTGCRLLLAVPRASPAVQYAVGKSRISIDGDLRLSWRSSWAGQW